jgi:flagellar basal body P-ring protein FlgI
VLALRQSKYPALHTACGDIRDASLVDDTLKINTDVEYIYNIIMKPENFNTLTDILKGINKSLVLQVNLLANKNIEIESNIQKLKRKFGDNLRIE